MISVTRYLFTYPKVEKVIGKKEVGGKVKYRIRWEGYSSHYDSWEPEENLVKCKELIDEFTVSHDTRYTHFIQYMWSIGNLT